MKEETSAELASSSAVIPIALRRSIAWIRRLARRNPLAIIGGVILLVLLLMVLFPGLFATYEPFQMAPSERLKPPNSDNYFGTDQYGRDVFSRVVYGARISFTAGLSVIVVAVLLGTVVGGIAGYRGGIWDGIGMRLTDLFLAFPFLILALAIVAVAGRSLQAAILGLALVWWAQFARLVRAEVLSIKEQQYVEAARSSGASGTRILWRYVLPGTLPSVLVKGSLDIGQAILATAAMSFLGLGASPPSPEWGAMITDARSFLIDAWWYPTFPGLALLVAVLGFNLVGDGIRDYLDPRLRSLST